MSKWNLPFTESHMDKADGVYFQNMTTKQIKERLKKDDIILIPIGSTENHGPHAPYGEDTHFATRMAEAIALKTGCTVAMPTWYGSHPYHHLGVPGTVIIPDKTFIDMVTAVIAGFWNAGFRKQILVNSHGQEYIIPVAIQTFGKRYQVPALIIHLSYFWIISKKILDKSHGGVLETPWLHSCEGETSVALNLIPNMINMADAVNVTPKSNLPIEHCDSIGGGLQRPIKYFDQIGNVGLETLEFPDGVLGSPKLADANKVREALEFYMDYVVKLHDDILRIYPPGKLPENMSQRPKEEIEALLKGPYAKGGTHLFTVAWPE